MAFERKNGEDEVEGGPSPVEREALGRREALRKIVRTTVYAAPIATMLLVGSGVLTTAAAS